MTDQDGKPERATKGKDPWGNFEIETDQAGRWRFGPCTVWIKRTAKEWQVAVENGRDYLSTNADVSLPTKDEWPPPDHAAYSRFAFSETSRKLTLWPELSPISVVFSPETPVLVTRGEHVTLYVSTPLWVRLETGDPPVLLSEFPTYRPSDTWFGPNTREGEHCYAVRLSGRLHLNDLPPRAHRAVTPIQIRNRSPEILNVEQVRLPVQLLSLYRSGDGMLWTQPVVLERDAEGTGAVLHLKEHFEPDVKDLELVRTARERQADGFVVRAWHWFFRR